MLAPILIFTYKRLDPLKDLLDSLETNQECAESDLYIYSDKSDDEENQKKVQVVRDYLHGYCNGNDKFRSITIIEADKHKGLATSVISGVTDIIHKYGRVITLEDDLIVSRFFLSYMNRCLDYYESDNRIWSISGYSPCFKEKEEYDKAVYLDYRASSWGWATWKDRWEKTDWNVSDYNVSRWNPVIRYKLNRGGNDLPSMLREQMRGHIDSWAVRWCYYQSRNDMYSIAPKESMVINNGFESGATNCDPDGKEKFGNVVLSQKELEWLYNGLEVDKRVTDGLKKKHGLTIAVRVRDKLRKWKIIK